MTDTAAPERIGWNAVAWAVYDFGYSIFAFVVFARYLGDWIINDLGHPDYYYTSAQAVAAISLFVLMPITGVIVDVVGRHLPTLRLFTGLAIVTGAGIGFVDPDIGPFGVLPLIALATVSAVATGMTFGQFDPLLASVAPKDKWSEVSGAAVGAGYVGIVAWLAYSLLGTTIEGSDDIQFAFIAAGLVFLVAAAPLLLSVRERPRVNEELRAQARKRGVARTALTRLRGTYSRLRQQPGAIRFLLGRLCYADAIGTVQIYAIVYMSRLGGFTEHDKNLATLVVVLVGVIGAVGSGWIARNIGPRRTLMLVLPLFSVGLAAVALAGASWSIWVLTPIVGLALGTVYTVDRVFMLRLTPVALRGEAFGLFNLIGRAGQAFGPFLLWGGVIWVLHDATHWLSALDASRISLGLLALTALGGLWVISSVDDHQGDGLVMAEADLDVM
jgi:UMF1 family MFS transporter